TIGRYRNRTSSSSSLATTDVPERLATCATWLPSDRAQHLGSILVRQAHRTGFTIRQLLAPAGRPRNLHRTLPTEARRQPCDVDQAAAKRAQPDPEELFVQNRCRLVLEVRQRVAGQQEARMPRDPLSDIRPCQPLRDVLPILRAHRRVSS